MNGLSKMLKIIELLVNPLGDFLRALWLSDFPIWQKLYFLAGFIFWQSLTFFALLFTTNHPFLLVSLISGLTLFFLFLKNRRNCLLQIGYGCGILLAFAILLVDLYLLISMFLTKMEQSYHHIYIPVLHFTGWIIGYSLYRFLRSALANSNMRD